MSDAVGRTHHARLVRGQAGGLDEQAEVLVRLLELVKLHDVAVADLVPGAKGASGRVGVNGVWLSRGMGLRDRGHRERAT